MPISAFYFIVAFILFYCTWNQTIIRTHMNFPFHLYKFWWPWMTLNGEIAYTITGHQIVIYYGCNVRLMIDLLSYWIATMYYSISRIMQYILLVCFYPMYLYFYVYTGILHTKTFFAFLLLSYNFCVGFADFLQPCGVE